MALDLAPTLATLSGAVGVEEAEPLAAWLRETADPAVDLESCTHLHTAALQALLAAGVTIAVAPEDPFLATHVLPALLRAAELRPTEGALA